MEGPKDKPLKDWVPLLQDPCSFLQGPSCAGSRVLGEKIGIVGAGMAGLTLAWVLQQLGHTVGIYRHRNISYHG